MYLDNPGALWSGDYLRNLEPRTTPYDDAKEDQDIKPEDVLKYESSDEPSLDFWVYDGHSIDDIPTYRDVESPLKDMFVLASLSNDLIPDLLIQTTQFGTLAWLFLHKWRRPRNRRHGLHGDDGDRTC